MRAFEHLKFNKILKGGLYKRFLNYQDGYTKSITKGEFEQFVLEYEKKHAAVLTAIDKCLTKDNFKASKLTKTKS